MKTFQSPKDKMPIFIHWTKTLVYFLLGPDIFGPKLFNQTTCYISNYELNVK